MRGRDAADSFREALRDAGFDRGSLLRLETQQSLLAVAGLDPADFGLNAAPEDN